MRLVKRLWYGFNGQITNEKAVAEYEFIAKKYEKSRNEYIIKTEELCAQLREHISNINAHKERIQKDLFKDLVELLSLLKDVDVPEEFCEEQYKRQCRNLETFTLIRTRDSLLAIDFDKNKVKTSLQAIFTLGFYTRKKARESLRNVENEELVLAEEKQKMRDEIAKLEACVASAAEIEDYFRKMSSLFEAWLRYMEHAVHYISYAAMRISKRVCKKSISISFLHEKQQKELNATINLGKTLAKMIQTQIVLKPDENNLDEYRKQMKESYEEYAEKESA